MGKSQRGFRTKSCPESFFPRAAVTATGQASRRRSITMIAPFAADKASDVTARIVSEQMSGALGQQIVIEDIAGARGTTGSLRAMRAPQSSFVQLEEAVSVVLFDAGCRSICCPHRQDEFEERPVPAVR